MIEISLSKLRISFTFGFFFVLALAAATESKLGAASLLFFILHELGHLAVMQVLGIRATDIRFYGAGIAISADGTELLSKPKRAAIYLGGITVNLILACFLSGDLRYLNLAAAIFNLLPISYFDGGRLLSLLIGHKAEKYLNAVSYIAVAAAVVYLILRDPSRITPSSVVTLIFIAFASLLDRVG